MEKTFTSLYRKSDYTLPGPHLQCTGMKHRLAALEKLYNACYAKFFCSNEVVLSHHGNKSSSPVPNQTALSKVVVVVEGFK